MAALLVRMSEKEKLILAAYCRQERRSQTDVVREFIRELKAKIAQEGSR